MRLPGRKTFLSAPVKLVENPQRFGTHPCPDRSPAVLAVLVRAYARAGGVPKRCGFSTSFTGADRKVTSRQAHSSKPTWDLVTRRRHLHG